MEPLSAQRDRAVAPARRPASRGGEPARLTASVAAAIAHGHPGGLSASRATGLQRLIGNAAVSRMVAEPSGSAAGPVVQRLKVDEMKQSVGSELLEKHVGTDPLPDLSTADAREQAVAAVYYQRAKGDRRTKNTVLFVNPTDLFADLRKTNENADLKSGPDYTTSNSYPAITVLVVGVTNKDSTGGSVKGAVTGPYKKFEIEHGLAKPMVRINKDHGEMAFNHLQETSPKKLGTTHDLLTSEG